MHGERVGALQRRRDGYELAYDWEAVERLGPRRAQLSTALPPREEPYGPEQTRSYVEGLLPQGPLREAIAAGLGLDPGDGYGLTAALGRDCRGAVAFLPEGQGSEPGEHAEPAEPAWVEEEELAEALAASQGRVVDPEHPERMRFALPGRRHKLALVRDGAAGRWAWPGPGLPSTHVLKPEPAERPGAAALEAACAHAYRALGLPAAHAEVEEVAGVTCLVSKRFDRWGDGPGAERLHCESFAQALGIPPEASARRRWPGAPTIAESAELLRTVGEAEAVETLMTACFCDAIVGNAEALSANCALLHGREGPMLAPFVDLAGTEIYGDRRPLAEVPGIDASSAPLLSDLASTIFQCEVEFQPGIVEAAQLMAPICKALGAAAERAVAEDWYRRAIDETAQLANLRLFRFAGEAQLLRPPGV